MNATKLPDIAVRKMPFEFPPDLDLVFVEDDPELSYTFVGTWFMLPYLEPYLMRTMHSALEIVQDPQQRDEMQRFIQQEGFHHRMHAKANEVIRARNPRYAPLKDLETQMAEEFKSFSQTKPLEFNLAYAEGFECMTSAASSAQVELGIFEKPGNPLRELALWHVMEELEHRNVAFDAYKATGAGYFYRLRVGLWAQRHFMGWGMKLAKVMLEADKDILRRYEAPEIKARALANRKQYWKAVIPRWLAIYTPWYSPHKLRLSPKFEEARARMSALAISIT